MFLASTATPEALEAQAGYLENEYGALVVGKSPHLANRPELEKDLGLAEEAEVLVTELKAAGVDTVSTYADRREKDLVYLENIPVGIDGTLEAEVERLDGLARRRHAGR